MQNDSSPLIYFHVGLGKVASKYLQHDIFPHFRGIHYVPTTKYYRVLKYIQEHPHPIYLVSREFDQQLESEVIKFATNFPRVRAIILLRRHASWIASQYRRFAKNGFYQPFNAFLDLDKDLGRFKQKDLDFYDKILTLEKQFGTKPLVLFHEDLIADPHNFVKRIAEYCQATFPQDKMSMGAKHTSYGIKQIKIMQAVSRYIPFGQFTYSQNKLWRFFQRLPEYSLRYAILYLALLVPNSWVNQEPLIASDVLKQIDCLTEQDWERCKAYALSNNPV